MNLREEILKNSGLLVETPLRRTIETEGEIEICTEFAYQDYEDKDEEPNDNGEERSVVIRIPSNITIDYDKVTAPELVNIVLKSKPSDIKVKWNVWEKGSWELCEGMSIRIIETNKNHNFNDSKEFKIKDVQIVKKIYNKFGI